ncbi:MAG: serine hydrolase [Gemmatimonadaceae bacterium]
MSLRILHRTAVIAATALSAIMITAPGPAAAQRPAADPARALQAYVTGALANWGLPGTAVAVVRNDSIVFARGFGVRELGKPEPVTANSVFAIGSTTKAFTATALGMLADSGAIAWDDKVTRHLPAFQLFDPYVTRELTVRDLLTHRSGLTRGDRLWAGSQFGRAEVLQRVRFLEPTWSFRSSYGYQNIMFLAAGTVVEQVGGTSWDEFVRERILSPLGMRSTVTSVSQLAALSDVASPHERIDGAYRPVPWLNIDNIGPAGSLNSSVNDMAQWLRLQLGGGSVGGHRLVSAKSMKETHTPQMITRMSDEDEQMWPMSHLTAYGLGWSIRDYYGEKMVAHGGAIRGMRAQVTLVPESKLGVVVLVNGPQSSFPTAIANKAVDLYLGHPSRDWSALMLAAARAQETKAADARQKLEAARVAGTSPSLALAKYAGEYADSMYGPVQVRHEGTGLVITFGPNQTGDLAHWHFDTFEVVWRDKAFGRGFVSFLLDARGAVSGLELQNVAKFGRATP